MYRKYLDGIAAVCYSICAVAVLGLVCYLLKLSPVYKLTIFGIAVISGSAGSYCRCLSFTSEKKRHKTVRITAAVLFLFYLFVLCDFTLIDESLGRNIFNVFSWNETAFSEYLSNHTNMIPFATVRLFIAGFLRDKLPLGAMLENIFGNLAAFMPFALFVPLIFKRIKHWYQLLAVVVPSVMMIELLQFIFLTGSSDIDDVILNSLGAMLFFGILRSKRISRLLKKVTFGEWEYNEK